MVSEANEGRLKETDPNTLLSEEKVEEVDSTPDQTIISSTTSNNDERGSRPQLPHASKISNRSLVDSSALNTKTHKSGVSSKRVPKKFF